MTRTWHSGGTGDEEERVSVLERDQGAEEGAEEGGEEVIGRGRSRGRDPDVSVLLK